MVGVCPGNTAQNMLRLGFLEGKFGEELGDERLGGFGVR
jgi:hypothetical protein